MNIKFPTEFACIVALTIAGCAAPGPSTTPVRPRQTLGPLVIYAPIDQAVDAAITALSERRLSSPAVDRTDTSASVRGELSGISGAVYNSHGGTGVVTITAPFPGSKRLTISAVTQSRLAHEPVGAMDALKGYNYNDPKHGSEIQLRIAELLPQGDLEHLRAEDENARLAWEEGKQRELADAAVFLIEVARGSRFACTDDSNCRKAFALAQIYVNAKSDMKIQLATDAIIETYNPTDAGKMGAKVIKMPGPGQSADIVLTVSCRECSAPQQRKSQELMRDFRRFVESRLRQ